MVLLSDAQVQPTSTGTALSLVLLKVRVLNLSQILKYYIDKFDDVASNFDSLYLESKAKNQIYQLDVKWGTRLSQDIASVYLYKASYWENISYSLIKNHVKLFDSFTIADTSFLICFDNIVFIYDIIRKIWTQQIYLKEKVKKLFRSERPKESVFSENLSLVSAYCESGQIYVLEQERDPLNDRIKWKLTDKVLEIKGKIEFIVTDTRDYTSHFIQTIDSNQKRRVLSFFEDDIKDYSVEVPLSKDSYLLKYYSSDVEEDIAVFD